MGASLSELKPGETVSASDANRFAIAAMANVIHYTREELIAMVKQFGEFAEQTEPKNCMDREQFLAGLEIIGAHETDQETHRLNVPADVLFRHPPMTTEPPP